MVDGGNRARGQHLAQGKGHVGGLPHFRHRHGDQGRQPLAAMFDLGRHGVPAVLAEGGESLFYAGGSRDDPVLADATGDVAGLVQRREHVAGEFAGLLQNGLDQIIGDFLIAGQRRNAGEVANFPHGEKHVADRRLIGGHDGLRKKSPAAQKARRLKNAS